MKVLIVVDMQNDFIDGALGTAEAQGIVSRVAEKVKDAAGIKRIYFTMDTHGDDYLETQEGRNLPVAHCVKDSPGWQIRKELTDVLDAAGVTIAGLEDDDTPMITDANGVFRPKTVDTPAILGTEIPNALGVAELGPAAIAVTKGAFGSAHLARRLHLVNQMQPIEEIELVGLCTDICVISNAILLKAFMPEVPIVVDASCCAGVSPESHENALRAMQACQIEIR